MITLSGCNSRSNTDAYTLWVVTEESTSDGMNYQAKEIAQRMEEEYEGLTIKIDILPTEEEEREIVLKQLRTKIMAGNGPDVYLLPTGNALTLDYPENSHRKTRTIQIEPLFLDVTQATQNGLFADLQTYYALDESLGIDALNATIMNAGVLSGRRYILPLRYDIPAIFTAPNQWENYGITEEIMTTNAAALTDRILNQANDRNIAASFQLPTDLSLLSNPFDYSTETILITPQEIANYMRVYQEWNSQFDASLAALLDEARERYLSYVTRIELLELHKAEISEYYTGRSIFSNLGEYFRQDVHWSTFGLPVYTGGMEDALRTVVVERLSSFIEDGQLNLTMYPLRTQNGTVAANVTYWGAVGSSCSKVDIAYAYLREFLAEDYQWDIYRPQTTKRPFVNNYESQCDGFVENSWPVRTAGSVPYMLSTLQYQERGLTASNRKVSDYLGRQLQIIELIDADFPPLQWEIDEVRFPITLTGEDSMEYALSLLNEPDGTPTDVDIDALAEKVWQNLWWHLAEG